MPLVGGKSSHCLMSIVQVPKPRHTDTKRDGIPVSSCFLLVKDDFDRDTDAVWVGRF